VIALNLLRYQCYQFSGSTGVEAPLARDVWHDGDAAAGGVHGGSCLQYDPVPACPCSTCPWHTLPGHASPCHAVTGARAFTGIWGLLRRWTGAQRGRGSRNVPPRPSRAGTRPMPLLVWREGSSGMPGASLYEERPPRFVHAAASLQS
jgi:hypothetical protein